MNKRSLLFVFSLTIALFLLNQWFSPPKKSAVTTTPAVVTQMMPPVEKAPIATLEAATDEKLYVIENEFQQLVFSNKGGALAEINLPFASEKNPNSVVRPIGIDKRLAEDYPFEDQFPERSYTVFKNGNLETITQTQTNGYYPLLRRDFHSQVNKVQPFDSRYYALNVRMQNEQSSLYALKRLDKYVIEFEGKVGNAIITKTYTLPQKPSDTPYCFNLSVRVDGDARYLSLTSGIPEVELISGSSTPSLKYMARKSTGPVTEQLSLPKASNTLAAINPEWVANSNGFLGLIIQSLDNPIAGFTATQIPGDIVPTRLSVIDAEHDLYPAKKYPGFEISIPLNTQSETSNYRIFAGPFEDTILGQVDEALLIGNVNPAFSTVLSQHGWLTFISGPFSKFLYFLMKFFYFVTHSWGFSIILLTLALRVMLYPLNAWSIKSTAKMQKVAPEVQKLQERYKKDPKKAQMEVVALYREKGVNPFSGCLPLIIQLPFLIGMFDLLKSTFELRGTPFIPHWIENLTAPDVLFSWNYPIPFFGTSFHLLPFLLGAAMFWQQKMSAAKAIKGKELSEQQKQQKLMGNIMTIVFTVMFYHFPSGLNLYWLSSMLLGIFQQWWMMKKLAPPKIEVLK